MSPKNRGDRIQLLQKIVTKHYTPVAPAEDRSVLEQLLYACCLEDTPYEAADEAFHRLQESFFDWNEVRVTTVSELCETLHNLPEPSAAAMRIKKNLQSLFETRYSFDIDDMIKMNQGKAVQELEKLGGMTKFVLAYVTQNALGGHAIPVSHSIMQVLLATEIVSPAEAEKGQAPGLERTIAKTKGAAFSSCLHQLAVAYALDPGNKQVKAIMKEAGASELKPPVAAPPKPPSAPPPASSAAASSAAASPPPASSAAAASSPSGKSSSKAASQSKATTKKTASKSGPAKPAPAAKSKPPVDKKPPPQQAAAKKAAAPKPTAKSGTSKKSTKRKPR